MTDHNITHMHRDLVHIAERLRQLTVYVPLHCSVVGMQEESKVVALPITGVYMRLIEDFDNFGDATAVADAKLGAMGVSLDL